LKKIVDLHKRLCYILGMESNKTQTEAKMNITKTWSGGMVTIETMILGEVKELIIRLSDGLVSWCDCWDVLHLDKRFFYKGR